MFIEVQLCGFVCVVANSSTGKKDGVVTTDFNADVQAGFMERHGDCFFLGVVCNERENAMKELLV